jgi:hypothetical protein
MNYRDFCPLCGTRFKAESPREVEEQILAHTDFCKLHFVPWSEALGDESYSSRPEAQYLWPRKN